MNRFEMMVELKKDNTKIFVDECGLKYYTDGINVFCDGGVVTDLWFDDEDKYKEVKEEISLGEYLRLRHRVEMNCSFSCKGCKYNKDSVRNHCKEIALIELVLETKCK